MYDYTAHNNDELSFTEGDRLVILRKGDEMEREWWWSRLQDKEGYAPRNLLGVSFVIFVFTGGTRTSGSAIKVPNSEEFKNLLFRFSCIRGFNRTARRNDRTSRLAYYAFRPTDVC